MKLTDYARELGVTRQTANRWFHEGKIPGAYQLDTGTIEIPIQELNIYHVLINQ